MNGKDLEKLKRNLPAHPGILGREKYINSAVLIPLVWMNGEYHFLFQKRAANIRQEGEICFPGGIFDPRSDPGFLETAVRETIEELGIEKEKIFVEGRLDTLVATMGTVVEPFVGRLKIKSISELPINKKEVEETFTLPVSFFNGNNLEEYKIRLEAQPYYRNENGDEIAYFPAKELKLPEKYQKPWGGSMHRIFVYRTEKGPVWGITAELVHEMVNKLSL